MSEMNMTELARRLHEAHGDPEKFGDYESLLEYLDRVEKAGDEIFEKLPLDEQAAAHSIVQALISLHLLMKGKLASAMLFGTPNDEMIDAVRTMFKLAIGIAVLEEWR